MHLYVLTETGKTVRLNMELCNTVGFVKATIQEKEGLLPAQQFLVFAGQELENNRTLADYKIEEDSTIQLTMRTSSEIISVFVQNLDGTTFAVELAKDAAVKGVKEKLESMVGVSARDQRLIYAGKQLEDNYTIRDYGVLKNSTIYLMLRLLGGRPAPRGMLVAG